jgi:hypothetical protein
LREKGRGRRGRGIARNCQNFQTLQTSTLRSTVPWRRWRYNEKAIQGLTLLSWKDCRGSAA